MVEGSGGGLGGMETMAVEVEDPALFLRVSEP